MAEQTKHVRLAPRTSNGRGPPDPETRLQPAFATDRRAVRARHGRVRAIGKHLAVDGTPFRVRGVTYGSFRSRSDGAQFPEPARIRADFASIAAAGLNVVRTYVLPPEDLLEIAEETGLRVLVGLNYDDWRVAGAPGRRTHRAVLDAGRRAVADAMQRCEGRASVLAIAVGNEIPADLVRLYGIHTLQRTLSALIDEIHEADPQMPATYCNYPTTEYLEIEGQDIVCFNVFLESEPSLRAYLKHLQVVSADRPLLLTEVGLASEVHGERAQSESLAWQLRAVDEAGCAGATIFSWTDEWAVAGVPVEGWGFGITDAERSAKPALEVARDWSRGDIRTMRSRWPRITAIVCAYNEERTLDECLASLQRCEYPDLEVIVCDDGSTDATAEIAARFPFRVLRLPHEGLSVARNAGMTAATGDIVAYLDADAACHEHWPYHIALALESPSVGAAGGPNLPVPLAGFIERAVGLAPGGPIHVLISDDRAEHVPGCNMAFRKEVLEGIGGFDPIFTSAGDDVDVCWKILDAGYKIAYAPAAQVLHHRRATIRGYLRQQRSYGRAERMVSGRHRHRYRWLGQARWTGSIYAGPRILPWLLRPVVYHGRLGMAPFQGVVRHRSHVILGWAGALLPAAIPLMLLGALAPLSRWWLAPGAIALACVASYAFAVGLSIDVDASEPRPRALRFLAALLHLAQPVARTWGRLLGRPADPLPPPAPRDRADRIAGRAEWLTDLQLDLSRRGCATRIGEPHASWDLEVGAGPLVVCRVTTAIPWDGVPVTRAAIRPRPAALVAASAGAALAAAGSVWAGPVLALVVAGALVETTTVRRRVHRTLQRGTRLGA